MVRTTAVQVIHNLYKAKGIRMGYIGCPKDAPVQKIQILSSLAGVGMTAWQVKYLHSSE